MKITDVKAYPFWLGERNICLVKVETDEGVYGWGESGLSSRELAVIGAIHHFREFLVGKNPFAIGALWQEMYRSQYFEGGRVLTAAISAIDIALYDLKGKALGVPVYELLGGKQRNHVPCFITTSKPMGDVLIEEAKTLMADGWTVIRTLTGVNGKARQPTTFNPRQSIAEVAACLTELRQELGAGITLGMDYHHRLSVAEAASFCQKTTNWYTRFPGGAHFGVRPRRPTRCSARWWIFRLPSVRSLPVSGISCLTSSRISPTSGG